MRREQLLHTLIDGLYDAAWQPSAWSSWLTQLGDAIGGGAVVLHLASPTAGSPAGWRR